MKPSIARELREREELHKSDRQLQIAVAIIDQRKFICTPFNNNLHNDCYLSIVTAFPRVDAGRLIPELILTGMHDILKYILR